MATSSHNSGNNFESERASVARPLPDPTFSAALLKWYDSGDVPMPWRGSRDPYCVWLSEVMLQQTRIATVEKYYMRFLQRFPTIQALAAAPIDDVLKCWEGLAITPARAICTDWRSNL